MLNDILTLRKEVFFYIFFSKNHCQCLHFWLKY